MDPPSIGQVYEDRRGRREVLDVNARGRHYWVRWRLPGRGYGRVCHMHRWRRWAMRAKLVESDAILASFNVEGKERGQ